jgi:phenylalanyl-tRNA synthetase beta chain
MQVPISWLKEYVKITLPIAELAERLTLAGLEVKGIEYIGLAPEGAGTPGPHAETGRGLVWDREKILIAQVLEVKPHPNADRLVLADVDYGAAQLHTIVTGAPNLLEYKGAGPLPKPFKVAYAKEGAQLYDGHQPGWVVATLKPAKIRGVMSDAMACSEKELGLSDDHTGIMILPDDAPVGMPLADYLGDVVLEIEITPNIARCACMVGVAREVAALTGQKMRYSPAKMQALGKTIKGQVEIEIVEANLCSRYSATLIRDVKLGPSPFWMQQRLRRAGMRPISNIVDITNYVMLEWGQPLHAFDYDRLVERAGGQMPKIIVRPANPGERMQTLDGADRELATDDLLITDTAGPIAIAGVMGGAETEVTETTRNILLESANFYFIANRRTAQRHKLPSEASYRFSRGVHPALTIPSVQRASELMRLYAGGTIARGIADQYVAKARPVIIALKTDEVRRILGIELPVKQIVRILESLEFTCQVLPAKSRAAGRKPTRSTPHTPRSTTIRVTVPDHRLDCTMEADLIEEIARIHGYDRLPVTQMADVLPPQRSNPDLEAEEHVRDILVGAGLQEIVTYSLTMPEREALLLPDRQPDDRPYVRLENPLSADRVVMRHTLMAAMLDTIAANVRHHDRVAMFELAPVYLASESGPLPDEPRRLCIGITGPRDAESWLGGDRKPLDFWDLKGIVENLVTRMGILDVSFEPGDHPSYHPGRCARLVFEGKRIGTFGELYPLVRKAFDLPEQPVALGEFDLEALIHITPAVRPFVPVSRYPAVVEDIAVIVDETVPAARVIQVARTAGGALLRDVRLFDLYRGEQIGVGHKSLACRLAYQADDRTLTDDDAAKIRARVVKALEQELGATLRA